MDKIRHRGPDGQGFRSFDATHLGHRRLSIVDLHDSQQPMSSPDGRYHLTYNGEIYNYRELRPALEGRWAFRSEGDTEVLLAGLVLHGQAFLDRMEGMWSFCLWDNRTSTLLAARDRFGKKPLFYASPRSQIMAAASELTALRILSPESDWAQDLQVASEFLRFGFPLPGRTIYRGIHELAAGHVLNWSTYGSGPSIQPWWRPSSVRGSARSDHPGRQLADAFDASVRKRLVADVEVGAFLSGGVDSSLVCATATSLMEKPLRTFTIGFEDPGFDESEYATQVACALGTRHRVQRFGQWAPDKLTNLILRHVGQPFGDPSLLPTAMVSSVAAGDVKVALSGDGGDELFSGYERYRARLIMRWYSRLPFRARKWARDLVRHMPEPTTHHSRSLIKKAHLFMDVVDRYESDQPYIAPSFFTCDQIDRLMGGACRSVRSLEDLAGPVTPDEVGYMMCADQVAYLPQDILVKVDRASMAHSLEVRAPFLDSKIFSLVCDLPSGMHWRFGRGKQLLKSVLGQRLPANIWRRRKQGFGVPVHDWFRGALGDELLELVAGGVSPLDNEMVAGLMQAHRSGARDHGYRLWNIYVYLLWQSRGALPES